jgi:ABC-type lipoprotein export system ATPase subunit
LPQSHPAQNLAKVERTTIIVVTHDLNITKHTDLTFQLLDGKLVTRDGHIRDLLN